MSSENNLFYEEALDAQRLAADSFARNRKTTMTTTDLVLPQTSINGTSVDALVEQQAAVITALCQVERRMAAAMPHGRDYQYRPAEYPQARDAWIARMQAIAQLKQELVEHAVAIRRTEG